MQGEVLASSVASPTCGGLASEVSHTGSKLKFKV